MTILTLGLLFIVVTLVVMFSGMPIAFSLGTVAMIFMFCFMPSSSLDTVTQNVYEEMASITLLSIPLFISALIWMIIIGALGYRAMRATQMATQYSWAYESSGLNWRAKGNG